MLAGQPYQAKGWSGIMLDPISRILTLGQYAEILSCLSSPPMNMIFAGNAKS
jgi:hypothetical protein